MASGSNLSFGVFFTPMLQEFGWTRAGTSGPFSLCMILSAIVSFVSGRLSDRFGARVVVSIGGLCLGVGLLLTSFTSTLWQFYLFFGVLTAIGMGSMYVPLTAALTRWFDRKKRGITAGIAISGIGLGIGIIPSVASRLIEVTSSWRASMMIVGILDIAVIVILAQLLKNRQTVPIAANQKKDAANLGINRDYSFKEAFRTKQFWILIVCWIFYGIFFHLGLIHIVPYAIDTGMSAIAASLILLVIGLTGVIGRICMGVSGDKLGIKNTIIISFAILGLAYIALLFSKTTITLYVFAVFFGFFQGIGILVTAFVAEHFGLKSLGAITGAVVSANSLGGAIGPTLAGSIFDISGSYFVAFLMCAVMGIICSLMIWRMNPIH